MKLHVSLAIVLTTALFFAGSFTNVRAAEKEKTLTVVGIINFRDMVFWQDIEKGMRAEAKKAKVNFLLAVNGSDKEKDARLIDIKKEARLINNYTMLGVDAIVIAPGDAEKSIPALKRAHEKGVKIVTYNSSLKGEFTTSQVNSSQHQLGESTGKAANKYIKEHLGGKARIAILAFDSLLPRQSGARVDGFLSTVKKDLEDVEIVARESAWLSRQGIKIGGEIIAEHPEINLIYTANEGGTVGAQLAVKSSDKATEIKVFGTDASEQLLNMLMAEDDILQAVTAQQPVMMGAMAVRAAVSAAKGETVKDSIIVPGLLIDRSDQDEIKRMLKTLE